MVDAVRVLIPTFTAMLISLSGLAAVLYGYEVYGMALRSAANSIAPGPSKRRHGISWPPLTSMIWPTM